MHIAHTQREPSNTAHSSLRALPVGVERFRLKVTLLPAKLDVSRSLFLSLFFFFSFCEHTTNSNDFYISSIPLLLPLSLFLPCHLPILHHQANRQAGRQLSIFLTTTSTDTVGRHFVVRSLKRQRLPFSSSTAWQPCAVPSVRQDIKCNTRITVLVDVVSQNRRALCVFIARL